MNPEVQNKSATIVTAPNIHNLLPPRKIKNFKNPTTLTRATQSC